MNRQPLSLIITLGLSIFGTSTTLLAQHQNGKADIPFAFSVGGNQLSPGDYNVVEDANGTFWLLNGHGASVALIAHPDQYAMASSPKLLFNRYGDHYYLSAIWNDRGTEYRTTPSAQEKEARDTTPRVSTETLLMRR